MRTKGTDGVTLGTIIETMTKIGFKITNQVAVSLFLGILTVTDRVNVPRRQTGTLTSFNPRLSSLQRDQFLVFGLEKWQDLTN